MSRPKEETKKKIIFWVQLFFGQGFGIQLLYYGHLDKKNQWLNRTITDVMYTLQLLCNLFMPYQDI